MSNTKQLLLRSLGVIISLQERLTKEINEESDSEQKKRLINYSESLDFLDKDIYQEIQNIKSTIRK